MRDETVKDVLLADLGPAIRINKILAISIAGSFVTGSLLTLALVYVLNGEVTDNNLAKLATIASHSTGQPPTTHWAKTVGSEPKWLRHLLPGATINNLLIEVDVNFCSVRKPTNPERDYWEVRTSGPSDNYN